MTYAELRRHLDSPRLVRVPLGPDALRVRCDIPSAVHYDHNSRWIGLSKCTKRWWGFLCLDRHHVNFNVQKTDAELRERLAVNGISTIEFEWMKPRKLQGGD